VALLIQGRSENACKNRWNSSTRRRSGAGGGTTLKRSRKNGSRAHTDGYSSYESAPPDDSDEYAPASFSNAIVSAQAEYPIPIVSGNKRSRGRRRPQAAASPADAPPDSDGGGNSSGADESNQARSSSHKLSRRAGLRMPQQRRPPRSLSLEDDGSAIGASAGLLRSHAGAAHELLDLSGPGFCDDVAADAEGSCSSAAALSSGHGGRRDRSFIAQTDFVPPEQLYSSSSDDDDGVMKRLQPDSPSAGAASVLADVFARSGSSGDISLLKGTRLGGLQHARVQQRRSAQNQLFHLGAGGNDGLYSQHRPQADVNPAEAPREQHILAAMAMASWSSGTLGSSSGEQQQPLERAAPGAAASDRFLPQSRTNEHADTSFEQPGASLFRPLGFDRPASRGWGQGGSCVQGAPEYASGVLLGGMNELSTMRSGNMLSNNQLISSSVYNLDAAAGIEASTINVDEHLRSISVVPMSPDDQVFNHEEPSAAASSGANERQGELRLQRGQIQRIRQAQHGLAQGEQQRDSTPQLIAHDLDAKLQQPAVPAPATFYGGGLNRVNPGASSICASGGMSLADLMHFADGRSMSQNGGRVSRHSAIMGGRSSVEPQLRASGGAGGHFLSGSHLSERGASPLSAFPRHEFLARSSVVPSPDTHMGRGLSPHPPLLTAAHVESSAPSGPAALDYSGDFGSSGQGRSFSVLANLDQLADLAQAAASAEGLAGLAGDSEDTGSAAACDHDNYADVDVSHP
jgi:hypothetical protein